MPKDVVLVTANKAVVVVIASAIIVSATTLASLDQIVIHIDAIQVRVLSVVVWVVVSIGPIHSLQLRLATFIVYAMDLPKPSARHPRA